MPEAIPKISEDKLKQWVKLDYIDLVKEILALFISEEEIPQNDLNALIESALKSIPIPIKSLSDDLFVAELFHGPTMSFKDLALSVVGRLYEYFLKKNGKEAIVLVGTSGDTGSAAIHAFKGLEAVDIIVLLPKGRCTEIQERQMTTVIAENVHVFAVEGSSDDLDAPIQSIFTDRVFVEQAGN